jgi:RNA 2',3'-cyclic 3'-phosphodiesterase
MEKIRTFIAVELSEEVKRTLSLLQDKLKSGSHAPVRWTDPGGTHLTLQFLGYIDSGLTGRITSAMADAASGIHPFHLSVGGMGVFPDPRRVRVIWVGLTGDLEIITSLQKRIESAMKPLGFTPESRAFTPHLTLGRVRDEAGQEERQGLGQLVTRTTVEIENRLEVNSVHLFRSQLRPQGPLYTIVGSVRLK